MTVHPWSMLAIILPAVVAICVSPPRAVLAYNPTPSAPRGFYRLTDPKRLVTGDLVVSRLPADVAALADLRRYIPSQVPVLKRIAATAGDVVCRRGAVVFIDGAQAGLALLRDHAGRPLPTWSGCQILAASQVFLLNPARLSFDGRYFGPTSRALILSKARPLWTW
jgi:conjugative transfer signal peptidase TraF